MALKYFISRFNELYRSFLDKEGSGNAFTKLWVFVDYMFALFFWGASLKDYFAYGFVNLRCRGRRDYVTYRKYHRIMHICNDPKGIGIFRDKSEFNRVFGEYLGREHIDFSTTTQEEFRAFFNKYKEVFIKEVLGFRGIGIKVYSSSEYKAEDLYDKLKSESSVRYLVENRLAEHPALAEFHPASVNTIRVVTLYDRKHDKVHIMNARVRFGNHGNPVDNFHYGGIAANIELDSGIVDTVGFDVNDVEYVSHPMTGKQIIGFQIPNWSECKSFVERCARVVKNVGYVGWDVVPLANGSFVLIEGNDNADHDLQQMHLHGLWPEYKKVLREMK